MIGTCGASGCIDAATVGTLFMILMGCWALGFGMGKSVAWTKALGGAA